VPTQLAARAVLALLCVAAAVASTIAYVSVKRVDHAAHGFRGFARADFARTLRELRDSDSALNPSNYRQQGIAVAMLHVGRRAEAERTIVRAARAQPQNAFLWVQLTRIQVARGRLAAARASWAHARRLDPHLPEPLPTPA
jgi:predicted Zn-dependent protease